MKGCTVCLNLEADKSYGALGPEHHACASLAEAEVYGLENVRRELCEAHAGFVRKAIGFITGKVEA